MPPAAWVTVLLVGVLSAALVAYLTVIAYCLRDVSFTLGTVIIGVRSIANQTEPVGTVVAGIAADVVAIQGAFEGLLAPTAPVPVAPGRRRRLAAPRR